MLRATSTWVRYPCTRDEEDECPAGARGGPRGSRASGSRAEVGIPAAASAARHAGAAAREPAGEADDERAATFGAHRAVPLAEGSDEGPVLRGRGAGADRRGGDGDRPPDGGYGPRDPAREGQDGSDAG